MFATYHLLTAPTPGMTKSLHVAACSNECSIFILGSDDWCPSSTELTAFKRALKSASAPIAVRRSDECEARFAHASFHKPAPKSKLPKTRRKRSPKKRPKK